MNKRNVGIDLLRIISMYMIVVLHVLGRGGVLLGIPFLSGKYALSWTIEISMYCAVNCYAIITGYVYYGKERKWENIIKLWLQTFFYSAGFATLFLVTGVTNGISLKEIVKLFLPLSSNRYWYFSAYVGVFLFIPFLNSIVEKCEQKFLMKNLMVITVFLSLPTVVFYSDPFVLGYGYSTIWLMILYIIGAYYKKYNATQKCRRYVIGYFGCVLGTSIVKYVITYVADRCGFELPGSFLATNITPTILGAAICLFLIFKNININQKWIVKLIAFLGPLSYGVFLIHVHPLVAKVYLDGQFSWIADKAGWAIILLVFGVAGVIYMLCLPIEIIRMFIFRICKINYFSKLIVDKIRKLLLVKVTLSKNSKNILS